jgi:hypothetical protein
MSEPTITVVGGGPTVTIAAAGTPGPAGADGSPGAPGAVQEVNGHTTAVITLTAADVDAVPTSGGTMTGPLVLDAGLQITTGATDGDVWTCDAAGHGSWQPPTGGGGGGDVTSVNDQTGAVVLTAANVGALATADNLSDLSSASSARTNLGLGGAATLNVGTTSATVAAGNDARIASALQAANNLADVANAGTARTNLGLGSAATENVGTGAGTVAAGNDSRIVGALQAANNLSDVASATAARTSLGLGTAATAALSSLLQGANNLSDVASESAARTNLGLGGAAVLSVGTAAGTVAAGNDARITGALQAANNLSDLASAPTARTNLGLGTAATAALASLLQSANNLSDLASESAARGNLGLGSAAVLAASAILQTANNLSDIANAATARTNLGLGTAAVAALSSLLQASNNLSDLANAATARTNLGLSAAATAALPLTIANGGTGQTGAQAAMNALAGSVTTGDYLRGNGTNVLMSAIQATDLPTATTSVQGALVLDGTATDIQPLGVQAAGASGLAADAKHVHPTTGVAVIDLTGTDIQPLGTQAPGSIGKASDAGHVHPTTGVCTTFNPSAARWNLKSETIPFYSGNLSSNLTNGTLFLMLLPWFANTQISKLSVYVTSIGATLTGVNELALYSSVGQLLSVTNDMTSNFGTVGWQEGTLTSPQTPTVDTTYYVGVLTHGGTAPKIWGFNMTLSPGAVNGTYPAIDFASQTAHANFTPSAGSVNSGAYWIGAR